MLPTLLRICYDGLASRLGHECTSASPPTTTKPLRRQSLPSGHWPATGLASRWATCGVEPSFRNAPEMIPLLIEDDRSSGGFRSSGRREKATAPPWLLHEIEIAVAVASG